MNSVIELCILHKAKECDKLKREMKESEVKWEAKIEEMWTLIEKAKTAKCEGSKQPTVGEID